MIRTVSLLGFPNYVIHSDGKVFSVKYDRFRKPQAGHQTKDYLKIQLFSGGRMRQFWLHRLIALAFYGEPPVYANGEKSCVRHLDADPLNNAADNLKYGSRVENEMDKRRIETHETSEGNWLDD